MNNSNKNHNINTSNQIVDRAQNTKSVYHIRSTEEISQFLEGHRA